VPSRPTTLWKQLPSETRLAAADALWRDDQAAEQQAEAIVMLAKRLNFRPKSLYALPIERRAKMLAQVSDVSDAIATRALISYHFARQRPLMAAFLDGLGIAHDDGLISAEDVPVPERDRLSTAVEAIRASFPPHDVDLYLQTLVTIDPETWGGIETLAHKSEDTGAKTST
jgi:hypothetical protein